jgi:threonine synthase
MSYSFKEVADMGIVNKLRCVKCEKEQKPRPGLFMCPSCPIDVNSPGILEVFYDDGYLMELQTGFQKDTQHGIWKWSSALPVKDRKSMLTLGEGNTPLVAAPRLANLVGFQGSLYIKNETCNPTGSYKDRLAAIVVSAAKEVAAEALMLVSSGNMGAAMAAYSAIAGIKAVVIVPPSTAVTKMAQIMMYGGKVVRVKGEGTDRLNLSVMASQKFGWYNANSPLNPYGPEGAKTAAYEEWLQLGKTAPDWVVIPVGFGCNLVGHWRGFKELVDMNLSEHMPRLAGIQSEGSPSFVNAFKQGRLEAKPGAQETIAGGISQKVTLNSRLGLRALRETDGAAEMVSDEEILSAEKMLAETEGIFAEPSAAASVAGFVKLVEKGIIQHGQTVILQVTGSGLKDPESTKRLVGNIADAIEARLDLLEQQMSKEVDSRNADN